MACLPNVSLKKYVKLKDKGLGHIEYQGVVETCCIGFYLIELVQTRE